MREDRGLPPLTRVAILVAAVAAIVAVLLGLADIRGSQQPAPPGSSKGPVATRIEVHELMRRFGPYLPLYQEGLPPFHKLAMEARTSQFSITIANKTCRPPVPRPVMAAAASWISVWVSSAMVV